MYSFIYIWTVHLTDKCSSLSRRIHVEYFLINLQLLICSYLSLRDQSLLSHLQEGDFGLKPGLNWCSHPRSSFCKIIFNVIFIFKLKPRDKIFPSDLRGEILCVFIYLYYFLVMIIMMHASWNKMKFHINFFFSNVLSAPLGAIKTAKECKLCNSLVSNFLQPLITSSF